MVPQLLLPLYLFFYYLLLFFIVFASLRFLFLPWFERLPRAWLLGAFSLASLVSYVSEVMVVVEAERWGL